MCPRWLAVVVQLVFLFSSLPEISLFALATSPHTPKSLHTPFLFAVLATLLFNTLFTTFAIILADPSHNTKLPCPDRVLFAMLDGAPALLKTVGMLDLHLLWQLAQLSWRLRGVLRCAVCAVLNLARKAVEARRTLWAAGPALVSGVRSTWAAICAFTVVALAWARVALAYARVLLAMYRFASVVYAILRHRGPLRARTDRAAFVALFTTLKTLTLEICGFAVHSFVALSKSGFLSVGALRTTLPLTLRLLAFSWSLSWSLLEPRLRRTFLANPGSEPLPAPPASAVKFAAPPPPVYVAAPRRVRRTTALRELRAHAQAAVSLAIPGSFFPVRSRKVSVAA
ncbi:uncharacterized protein BXZ73DRAFT_96339 [Epithele typhae]|uniref:uncharacterized protein n=1 Tax=Epithele typhae TaxID=378194 RepID=UPI0020077C95|nr:uncharacterized protein BXZ73DRAFT_96339 [Epithele typhae]KAH9945348.1 hypothetical protein BXZ73DRAFT_96339 [Epithele typhae]